MPSDRYSGAMNAITFIDRRIPRIGLGTNRLRYTTENVAFIRAAVGHDICARMRYMKSPLATAARAALQNVARLGGDGGLIAVDRKGNVAMPFNSEGMYRAAIDRGGRRRVAIF